MSTLLALLLSNKIILAIGGGIIAAAAAWFKGRLSGAKAERNKQLAGEAKARDIADDIDDAIAGRSPDANRKELGTWGRSKG